MKNLIAFFFSALWHRCAYIDMDGCVLEIMPVPDTVPKHLALVWWVSNLKPTPVIARRLPLLYVLRALGVKLFVWTNRSSVHRELTFAALGRHSGLFRGSYFMCGRKHDIVRYGPCMDDDAKYIGTKFADLLVSN